MLLIYTLVLQGLCNIEFLVHVTVTCIGSTFSYSQKGFLILCLPPHTKFNLGLPCMHSPVGSTPASQVWIPATSAD